MVKRKKDDGLITITAPVEVWESMFDLIRAIRYVMEQKEYKVQVEAYKTIEQEFDKQYEIADAPKRRKIYAAHDKELKRSKVEVYNLGAGQTENGIYSKTSGGGLSTELLPNNKIRHSWDEGTINVVGMWNEHMKKKPPAKSLTKRRK
jgi:hypothetical protein